MEPEVVGAVPLTSGRDQEAAPRLAFALPESKFHPPVIRPGIVVRTTLVERLAATQAPVITAVAPPGYGKTTVLAQWAERIGSAVVRLACRDGDNRPVGVVTALADSPCRSRP